MTARNWLRKPLPVGGAASWTKRGAQVVCLALFGMVLTGHAVMAADGDPELLVLSPAEGEELTGDLLIAVSFIDPNRRIDLRTVRLQIDG